jgi:chromosome segregation ATPase
VSVSGVVGKLTDIVSKNLGWDAHDESQTNSETNLPTTSLANVLQAVDDHMEAQVGLAGAASGQTERYEVAQTPALSSVQAIERLARANAAVRKRCVTIVRKVESLAGLDQDLASVFSHFDVVMGDLEQAHGALAETSASLAAERDAHDAMKVRYAAALEESERQRAYLQRQDEEIKDLEARVEQLNQLLFERTQALADLRAQEERDRERIASLMLDLQAARDDQQRLAGQISQLQDKLSSIGLRAELAEETSSAVQSALQEARQAIARLEASGRAASDDLAQARATASDLQHERDRLVMAHADEWRAQQAFMQDRQAETAALRDQLVALTVRFEAADRLLADLPVLLERAADWERKVNELAAQNERLQAQVNASETAQQAVADRAHTLVKAIKLKEKETARMKASLDQANERYEREAAGIAEERAAWAKARADLGQQLEKERAERQLVQASLECLQLERAEAQRAAAQAAASGAEPAEAKAPLAAGEAPPPGIGSAAAPKPAQASPSRPLPVQAAPSEPALVQFAGPPEPLHPIEQDKPRPRSQGKGHQRHRGAKKRQALRIE